MTAKTVIRLLDDEGVVVYQRQVESDASGGIVFPTDMPPLKPDWSMDWGAPTPPPDRLARLEGRVGVIEAVLKGSGPQPSEAAQEPAQRGEAEHQARMPAPRSVPDGVVPPHVRANLEALAEWTHPERWNLQGDPEERKRTRSMLDHLHGLVMVAMTGEDVPRPGA